MTSRSRHYNLSITVSEWEGINAALNSVPVRSRRVSFTSEGSDAGLRQAEWVWLYSHPDPTGLLTNQTNQMIEHFTFKYVCHTSLNSSQVWNGCLMTTSKATLQRMCDPVPWLMTRRHIPRATLGGAAAFPAQNPDTSGDALSSTGEALHPIKAGKCREKGFIFSSNTSLRNTVNTVYISIPIILILFGDYEQIVQLQYTSFGMK